MSWLARSPRRVTIYLALAGAEVSWAAAAFWLINHRFHPHRPLLLGLGMWILLVGFWASYRALVNANLDLRLQQGLLVGVLLLVIGFVLRVHVYAGAGLPGLAWLVEPFRRLFAPGPAPPGDWLAITAVIYLWARGIGLARRSLSIQSVGFGFRVGVVILMLLAFFGQVFTGLDLSLFVLPYFFFSLVAVALVRLDEVGRVPDSSRVFGSSRVGFGSSWIGSTVAAVGLLVLAGLALAALFSGGGPAQVLRWLAPVLILLQVVVVGLVWLLAGLLQGILSLLSIEMGGLGTRLEEMLQGLSLPAEPPAPEPGAAAVGVPLSSLLRVLICVIVPALLVLLVVLSSWGRIGRQRRDTADESREMALGDGLRSMVQAGRMRLGELAGLVDRFGLGPRFLSAVSIRRIYANLVRLATEAGYPRLPTQTPYEYLAMLSRAQPGLETDLARITEAYVNAHYGRVPDTRQELDRIRACWHRVRAAGIKRRGR